MSSNMIRFITLDFVLGSSFETTSILKLLTISV